MKNKPQRLTGHYQAYQRMQDGLLEGEEREGAGRIFEEAMPEQFPNLIENINLHIQEAQQPPSKTNAKRYTQDTHKPHNSQTIKKPKTKGTLKASREK